MAMIADVALILEATDFAAEKHRQQRRKDVDKTPYINHPIGVARILSREAGITDTAVLQAALLHDTVEDTDTTFLEIEERFGLEVRRIVEEVTDDKTLPKMERKRWTKERVQEYFQWASEVVKGLRGTNAVLEKSLHQLFMDRGIAVDTV
ncbi:guanosine-3',5'-bis(diphosphate) 3'-pyrophosphohydrolase MESH1 isoform X2 [Spea bombifrons]|uniref:guanosine-3',5'-bis(diphosphate) 3'-pyrophosphohydrolase MESH1 isoform X2 n=1 Tax=Spea bombifrons TaxID=233779 RepID=UPI00234A4BCE|nr:guanosine-3',5'-bis(diphosphate) 3'-pyrophosphohydrolase MESH1 isoform X2 [Spea bombifrons]